MSENLSKIKEIRLSIKCFKWLHKLKSNKYDEMFDYQTEKFIYNHYKIKSSAIIIDNFTDIELYEDDEQHKSSSNKSFAQENIIIVKTIKYDFPEYIISHNKYTYLVTKYYNNDDENLKLNIGKFIKIGKHILKIMALKLKNELKFKNKNSSEVANLNEECRVCFNEYNINDYLISVCDCKGSLKYIHPSCLKQWLKSKCDISYKYINPNYFKIIIENFFCEICKKNFPLIIKEDGNHEFLLDALKYKDDFLVFKSKLIKDEHTLNNIREDKSHKEKESNTHIIELLFVQFSKYVNKITIGRDDSNVIKLDDISVSRSHCELYLVNNILKIKDLDSKFGTLISMNEDIVLNEYSKIAAIQKGNTVYYFKII